MRVLGISAFYHDSAAALIEDGVVIHAVEEERFSRIKHDNQFPYRSIQWCLDAAQLSIDDIDVVAYYEKPLLKFERILQGFIDTYPFSLPAFLRGIPEWLGTKIKIEPTIRQELGFTGELAFVPHHLSHAAAAYYSSPATSAAILTIDGVGEHYTTAVWKAEGSRITHLGHIDFPHSVGLLYSTFTSFLGFRVNEDEYKVMGMAAYGTPRFADAIRSIIELNPDGSFALDLRYFSFPRGGRMWNARFETLFGKPRQSNEPITQAHMDMAASIQEVTEDIYMRMLNHLHAIAGTPTLCVGGGVALNALANGKIFGRTPFTEVHIFGPAGDGGSAIGCALYASHALHGIERTCAVPTLKLGSVCRPEEIAAALNAAGLLYVRIDDPETRVERTARYIAEGRIVGWIEGPMEFGPRALGGRSILAMPSPSAMKEKMNTIKRREQFRPFAVSILEERAGDYFDLPATQSAFRDMNFCFQVRPEKRHQLAAAVHADGSCRIQTLTVADGLYYELVRRVNERTGTPAVLNTSFNVAGEPLIERPEQAVHDFVHTPLDVLVIGPFLVTKPGG